MDQAIDGLQDILDAKNVKTSPVIRKLRSQVLNILTKMGIYNDNDDWERVNAYLSQSRIAGKVLYLCNEAELKALIKKLHAVHRNVDKKIQNENWLASNN